MSSLYRELYGPQNPSLLTSQDTHRSELLYTKEINEDETLRTNHTTSNIFWTFKIDDPNRVRLHPRVLDILYDIGFYHVARCGAIMVDNHLITALVERWRPETHTFHFPIGEATVTLQDIAIIWGLRIDGQPLTIDEHNKTIEEWRSYCFDLLGFAPKDADFKSKTRIKLTSLSSHLSEIEITDDTNQDTVDQYARGCVLLMLGSFMVPDSSRSHVSLLYLQAINDLAEAGTYSWGSAVLAYLYRELCNASDTMRHTIGGAVSLLQIWAWSRIHMIQPTNRADKLLKGPLFGANGRNLGPPPYDIRWTTHHGHGHSTRHSVRVYRDMFDRINDGDFHWIVYDMTSPEIKNLDDRCLTLNWMSKCPLIIMAIVEFHHPDRVLRQFGCIQGIPPALDRAHADTHNISFQGRDGCNWRQYHQNWIQYWNLRVPLTNTTQIHDAETLVSGYMQWYRSLTRLIISPSRYESVRGYQTADIAARDQVYEMMRRLNLAANEVTSSSTSSIEALRQASYDVVRNTTRLLGRQPLNFEPYAVESSNVGHCTVEPSTASSYTYTAGPSIDEHYLAGQFIAEPSTSRLIRRRNDVFRDSTHPGAISLNDDYIPQSEHYPAGQSTLEPSTSRSRRRRNSASCDSTHSKVPTSSSPVKSAVGMSIGSIDTSSYDE